MARIYRTLVAFLPRLWSNWITLLGSVIVSASAATILVALAIDLTSKGLNSYAAAVIFLVMPAMFGLGLIMVPVGLFFERRRPRPSSGPPNEADSALALFGRAMESQTVRRRVGFVLLATVLNVLIFSTVTYRAVTFMDTPQFCGTVCHSVMQPEYDAYNQSPHSHVACVECHIGSGASSLFAAKLSGLRQVWGIATGNFHRPIGTPVHDLRPASETCGNCHQPNRLSGTRAAFRVHFKEDEGNTPQVTAMMLHLGGQDPRDGSWSGIHFHASTRYQVRYEVLDDKRQTVGKIQKLDGDKVVKEWLPPPDRSAAGKVLGIRTMDCIDCHNRATHVYDDTPRIGLTRAFVEGQLDRKGPWLFQTSLGVLEATSPPREQADAQFRTALEERYTRAHPQQKPSAETLDQAAHALAAVYRRNVYPAMKLSWGNYPTQIGHGGPDPGPFKGQCFRCHAGDHHTADGQELSSKCELCHEVAAKDELPDDLPDELRPLLRL
jgi:nitrate/TMAO reductase-like tetraheme cytochrome c subunit